MAASLIAAPEAIARPGDTVTYTVNSDAPLKSVEYSDATGQIQVLRDAPANWSTSFTSSTPTPSLYVVAAQTSGTQASCEIMINGNVIMHTSGVGALECNSLFD